MKKFFTVLLAIILTVSVFYIPATANTKTSISTQTQNLRTLFSAELCEIKPSLIKPNETEILQFSNGESLIDTAKMLNRKDIKHVIISCGSNGGIYASNTLCAKISVPKINVVSTIGAGDSTIAGFIYSLYNGKSITEALTFGFSTGTAACLTEGTTPPKETQILKIIKDVKLDIL